MLSTETLAMDKAAVLEEAERLERMGAQWKVQHVAAVLNCAVSTVYNTPWVLKLCHRVGKRGRRWIPAQIRAGRPNGR